MKKLFILTAKLVFVLLLLLVLALGATANAQVYPQNLTGITNFPATVAAAAVSTSTNIVGVPRYGGISLVGVVNAASGTGAVVVNGAFSNDGTNWCAPWTLTSNVTSVTNVTLTTNWNSSQLAGYAYLNITTLTNATANGVLTNKGFIVNRVFYNY